MARFPNRSVLRPTGPLPRSAYWWRRFSILLVLVAVVILAVVISRLGGSGSSTSTRSPQPGVSSGAGSSGSAPSVSAPASATASNTPSASTSAGSTTAPTVPCAASNLSVAVKASARTYPAGAPAVFTATIQTTGPACVITGGLQIVVTSGQDRIWGSADCTPVSTTSDTLAASGSAAANRTWDRARTKLACAKVNGTTTAAAGTYRAVASWGGVTSDSVVFSLG